MPELQFLPPDLKMDSGADLDLEYVYDLGKLVGGLPSIGSVPGRFVVEAGQVVLPRELSAGGRAASARGELQRTIEYVRGLAAKLVEAAESLGTLEVVFLELSLFDPKDKTGEQFYTVLYGASRDVVERYIADMAENVDAGCGGCEEDERGPLTPDAALYLTPLYALEYEQPIACTRLDRAAPWVYVGAYSRTTEPQNSFARTQAHVKNFFASVMKDCLPAVGGGSGAADTCLLLPLSRPAAARTCTKATQVRGGGLFLYGLRHPGAAKAAAAAQGRSPTCDVYRLAARLMHLLHGATLDFSHYAVENLAQKQEAREKELFNFAHRNLEVVASIVGQLERQGIYEKLSRTTLGMIECLLASLKRYRGTPFDETQEFPNAGDDPVELYVSIASIWSLHRAAQNQRSGTNKIAESLKAQPDPARALQVAVELTVSPAPPSRLPNMRSKTFGLFMIWTAGQALYHSLRYKAELIDQDLYRGPRITLTERGRRVRAEIWNPGNPPGPGGYVKDADDLVELGDYFLAEKVEGPRYDPNPAAPGWVTAFEY